MLQTPESRSFFLPFIALSMIQINLSSEHFILSLSPRWKISTLNLVLLGNVETVPPSISRGCPFSYPSFSTRPEWWMLFRSMRVSAEDLNERRRGEPHCAGIRKEEKTKGFGFQVDNLQQTGKFLPAIAFPPYFSVYKKRKERLSPSHFFPNIAVCALWCRYSREEK